MDLDDAASYGLIVNWPADAEYRMGDLPEPPVHVPGSSRASSRPTRTTPPDLDITYLQVGGTYFFDGELARPYIVATVGASRFEPDDSDFDSENFFAFGIGGGVKLAPTSRVGLRLEGRVLGSVVNSDSAVFCRSGRLPRAVAWWRPAAACVWQWEVLAGLVFRL